MASTTKRIEVIRLPESGLLSILRKVHPRQVIWGMLLILIGLLAFIGKKYDDRLEKLETYKVEQNGHLSDISTELKVQGNDLKWIKERLVR
jgi:hypothetical protein